MSLITKTPRWGKKENEKLKSLIEKGESRGGICTTNLRRDYVKDILERKFKERNNRPNAYDNFARMFCQKVQAYNVELTLRNARSKYLCSLILLLIIINVLG